MRKPLVAGTLSLTLLLLVPVAAAGDGPLWPVTDTWEMVCENGVVCSEGCAEMVLGSLSGYQAIYCVDINARGMTIGIVKRSDGNCMIVIPIGFV